MELFCSTWCRQDYVQNKGEKRDLIWTSIRQAMKGVYTTSVNENTLDEAPMAYKSLDEHL